MPSQGDVTHPSAERVHERVRREMPNVSLKTVYQTLNDLAELGAISVLDVGTGSARFDPNVETTHHHLVCRSCGKVRDLAADFPGLTVSRRAAQGFAVDSAEIVFRGLCDECRTRDRAAVTTEFRGNRDGSSPRAERSHGAAKERRNDQPCQH